MKETADQMIDQIVKERGGLLSEVKEKIRETRKPRMRTVEQYLCDGCDVVIMNPDDGFVIHGNIYAADPVYLDGLIGNNFPSRDGSIADVKKTVLCRKCFLKTLGLGPKGDVATELTKMIRNSRNPYAGVNDQTLA